jgi:hypothetical protein
MAAAQSWAKNSQHFTSSDATRNVTERQYAQLVAAVTGAVYGISSHAEKTYKNK